MAGLRIASVEDADFLFRVYHDTNVDKFAALGSEMCEMLLRQQSSFQEKHYASEYPQMERFIILEDDHPVGRLYLSKRTDEWVLVDIAIVPGRQRSGTGTEVLLCLIGESKSAGCTLRLHVAQDNPAGVWYCKHGFKEVELKEPYIEMAIDPT